MIRLPLGLTAGWVKHEASHSMTARVAGAMPLARGRPRARPVGSSAQAYAELMPLVAMPAGLRNEWRALAAVGSEPNAFSEHWFMLPSLERLATDGDIRMAVVRDGQDELIGLLPLAIKSHYGRLPVANVQNWLHHNSFLGAPLIRKGDEARFWTTLIAALDASNWARGLLHIVGLVEGGPIHAGLISAAGGMGRRCDTVHSVRRAMLESTLDAEAYYERTVRKKKRKELARLAARLAELGEVRYATLACEEELAEWSDGFLALEQASWKGEAGSALACDDALASFFRDALAGAFAARQLDFHRLDLDGRPIAMLVNFLSAPGAFSFKIAFDEAYARYSPGVLIQRYNLRILDRPGIAWMDSCASQDHPMIDSLWAERRDVVRVSVPLGGAARGLLFRACRTAENAMARARAMRAPAAVEESEDA